jgi:hypothetical protein
MSETLEERFAASGISKSQAVSRDGESAFYPRAALNFQPDILILNGIASPFCPQGSDPYDLAIGDKERAGRIDPAVPLARGAPFPDQRILAVGLLAEASQFDFFACRLILDSRPILAVPLQFLLLLTTVAG